MRFSIVLVIVAAMLCATVITLAAVRAGIIRASVSGGGFKVGVEVGAAHNDP